MTMTEIERIADAIVRADMLAVERYAKKIIKEAAMNKSKENCTYPKSESSDRCPIGMQNCAHCGWDFDEDQRRRKLPLVKGGETNLRFKLTQRGQET